MGKPTFDHSHFDAVKPAMLCGIGLSVVNEGI